MDRHIEYPEDTVQCQYILRSQTLTSRSVLVQWAKLLDEILRGKAKNPIGFKAARERGSKVKK